MIGYNFIIIKCNINNRVNVKIIYEWQMAAEMVPAIFYVFDSKKAKPCRQRDAFFACK